MERKLTPWDIQDVSLKTKTYYATIFYGKDVQIKLARTKLSWKKVHDIPIGIHFLSTTFGPKWAILHCTVKSVFKKVQYVSS